MESVQFSRLGGVILILLSVYEALVESVAILIT